MNARETHDLPVRLDSLRRRFEEWRKTRKAPARIPESLWAAAVKMAGTYGLFRTARALPVDYYALKKRVEQQPLHARGKRESGSTMTFVQLPQPANDGFAMVPVGACDCVLELEDTAGAKMRIHLKAAAPPDLAVLCGSFWSPAS
jgi:hypothetical protein